MRKYFSAYPELKEITKKINEQNRPVYVCNIETTGLNPVNDKIIQIAASKCSLNGTALIPEENLNIYINPETELSDFTKHFVGRDDAFYASQKTLDEVMPEVRDFFGNDPVILSWTASNFVSKFLMHAGFMTGFMVYPCASINLMDIARSVIPVTRSDMNYKFKTISYECGVRVNKDSSRPANSHDSMDDVFGYIEIFNKLYPQCITGEEKVVVTKSSYWEKSNTCRGIYFNTDHGDVHIDANNYFFVEDTPGYFDTVDMDVLTKEILAKCHAESMEDVVRLYYQSYRSAQKKEREVG